MKRKGGRKQKKEGNRKAFYSLLGHHLPLPLQIEAECNDRKNDRTKRTKRRKKKLLMWEEVKNWPINAISLFFFSFFLSDPWVTCTCTQTVAIDLDQGCLLTFCTFGNTWLDSSACHRLAPYFCRHLFFSSFDSSLFLQRALMDTYIYHPWKWTTICTLLNDPQAHTPIQQQTQLPPRLVCLWSTLVTGTYHPRCTCLHSEQSVRFQIRHIDQEPSWYQDNVDLVAFLFFYLRGAVGTQGYLHL